MFSAAPPEFRRKAAENDYGDFEKKFNFDNSSVIYNESEIESKKNCTEENQFKRWDGKCFSCNYLKTVRVETHCNNNLNSWHKSSCQRS